MEDFDGNPSSPYPDAFRQVAIAEVCTLRNKHCTLATLNRSPAPYGVGQSGCRYRTEGHYPSSKRTFEEGDFKSHVESRSAIPSARRFPCNTKVRWKDSMSLEKDLTTLVCLFHTQDNARAAMNDLSQAGIAQSSITLIGGPNAPADALEKSELASLGMPDKDYDHLRHSIRDGGLVVAVTTDAGTSDTVEEIFAKHSAKKIDEVSKTDAAAAPLATEAVQEQTAIPVVAEELVVGKRAVTQGSVRVFRRVIEIPVEQSVNLREEHVTMERRPVDRAVSDSDLAYGDRTIELTETAEEAVISKNARVVEEVLVGKQASEHVETIHDTVRKTEVNVEQVAATAPSNSPRRTN